MDMEPTQAGMDLYKAPSAPPSPTPSSSSESTTIYTPSTSSDSGSDSGSDSDSDSTTTTTPTPAHSIQALNTSILDIMSMHVSALKNATRKAVEAGTNPPLTVTPTIHDTPTPTPIIINNIINNITAARPALKDMLINISRPRTSPTDTRSTLQMPLYRLLEISSSRRTVTSIHDLDLADMLHMHSELIRQINMRMEVNLDQGGTKNLIWRLEGSGDVGIIHSEIGLEAAIMDKQNAGKGTVMLFVVDVEDLDKA